MIQTYVLDTGILPDMQDDPAGWEACLEKLPAERVEKIRRIRHAEAGKQSLGAGLLLHEVCSRLAPEAEIACGAYGKPVCAELSFNLSHTKEAVILSVWEGRRDDAQVLTGCDIEKLHPYRSGIAGRFFTRAEYDSLEAVCDPQAQAELFCRYWTRKESVMKLTGLGLSLPMDLYDVRGSRPAADHTKVHAWYEKALKKGEQKPELTQAAEILLQKELFWKEYRYRDCCITVCSTCNCFASDYVLAKPDKKGI